MKYFIILHTIDKEWIAYGKKNRLKNNKDGFLKNSVKKLLKMRWKNIAYIVYIKLIFKYIFIYNKYFFHLLSNKFLFYIKFLIKK